MNPSTLDRLTVDSKDYIYRDGNWTTPTGYCVSTAHGQQLTLTFFERFGRAPAMPPSPVPTKVAIRAAVAKARALKTGTKVIATRRLRAPAATAR